MSSQGIPTQLGYTKPSGYVQLTSLGSAVGLSSIPAEARFALIQAESQSIRWRDDGTNPTTGIGMVLAAGATLVYSGTLSAIKLIETTASAKVNVTYYS